MMYGLSDMSSASGALDHDNLFDKLIYLGFVIFLVQYFISCLANKTFFISIGKVYTESGYENFWVSQGFVLYHLPFSYYVNDNPQALLNHSACLSTDDANIFYSLRVYYIETTKFLKWSMFEYRICVTLRLVSLHSV